MGEIVLVVRNEKPILKSGNKLWDYSDTLPHGEKEIRRLPIKLLWLNTGTFLCPTAQTDTLCIQNYFLLRVFLRAVFTSLFLKL